MDCTASNGSRNPNRVLIPDGIGNRNEANGTENDDAAVSLDKVLDSRGGGAIPSKTQKSGDERNLNGITESTKFFQGVVNKQTNIYEKKEEPLSTPWTFWRSRCLSGSDLIEYNLFKIYTTFTTSAFWSVESNLPPPSKYVLNSSLHVMRDMRKPLWEETYNEEGGGFRLRVEQKDLDKVWRLVLMAAIGEQLTNFVDDDDEVCGVSVFPHENLIIIWNKNANSASKAKVFECVQRLVPDVTFDSTVYGAHKKHPALGTNNRKGQIPNLLQ